MRESILSLDEKKLLNIPLVDKPFRAKQIIKSIYKNRIFDFASMTDMPKSLREYLTTNFTILNIKPIKKLESTDGTIKFLFKLTDDNYVESVYLKDKNNRITFCISTQSGCRMGCKFCKTGEMGLKKNLDFTEILSQILYLAQIMDEDQTVVDTAFNIVFMGMGEPLDNFENVTKSIKILNLKDFFDIKESRITISTSGLLDKIPLLYENFPSIKLAVSLITANQKKREEIMPIAKKFTIQQIFDILIKCYQKYQNRITLEYVLIKGFNMSDDDIKDLEIFNNKAFHLNLIPLNHNDNKIQRPEEKEIKLFQQKLENKGFTVTRRYRRGDDIKADCGQLYWDNTKDL
ncbi:MAG: 23S rRNA (adenine(2503)-C(2))-methyltransferase [Spirochaetes bacterium GWD1_27_9]|nr:MAG: 23S rRNA (adenine(2503)-C(2))-methyltransferase [Spirochaetes bacterium GWB1_27_13]OHD26507.1 MAG: 23S rRNA (adenine(2503)-C(2))-methyltransferase [Spirochaetes bacterium GWC1_27_15]OHD44804.1 MAG: 23S rRNA (adenine(2503)-C(2))-methyltransferase [Spirochaetes bacterium GWD1_27_9]